VRICLIICQYYVKKSPYIEGVSHWF
jgi:hypothetical protein